MKTATVRELRNDFGRLSKWLEKGETVSIVKRGKPFARVVPEPKAKSFLGAGQGSVVKIPDDIDEPLGIVWEAMK
jgi:antitoxin (DNA-binding transcriptional repressor) of toxin-antitoxin stability system